MIRAVIAAGAAAETAGPGRRRTRFSRQIPSYRPERPSPMFDGPGCKSPAVGPDRSGLTDLFFRPCWSLARIPSPTSRQVRIDRSFFLCRTSGATGPLTRAPVSPAPPAPVPTCGHRCGGAGWRQRPGAGGLPAFPAPADQHPHFFFKIIPRGRVCRRFHSCTMQVCATYSRHAAQVCLPAFPVSRPPARARLGPKRRPQIRLFFFIPGAVPPRGVFAPVVGSGRQNLHSLGRTNPSLRSAISSLQSIQAKSTTTPTPIPSATRIPTCRSSKSCMNGVRTTPLIEIIT